MATNEEIARLKLDADLLKQLTREPGWSVLETQLEGHESDALRRLLAPGHDGLYSDDWSKGYIAALRLVRDLPDKLQRVVESLNP